MKLFTKPECEKCEFVKKHIPAHILEPTAPEPLQIYDVTTLEGLTELAWHELVTVAEKSLPILFDNGEVITGAIKIKKWLADKKCSSTAGSGSTASN